MINVIEQNDELNDKIRTFILHILEDEYNFKDIYRPDIINIREYYQNNGGNFWVAIDDNNEIIGTIALMNCKEKRGYLKRFCVREDYRGKGIAPNLHNTLLQFCKDNNIQKIYLATCEEMISGIKFYEKNDYIKIPELPEDINPYGDDIFYVKEI